MVNYFVTTLAAVPLSVLHAVAAVWALVVRVLNALGSFVIVHPIGTALVAIPVVVIAVYISNHRKA